MSNKFETPKTFMPMNRLDLEEAVDTSRTNNSLANEQTLNESFNSMTSAMRRSSVANALKERSLAKIRSELERAADRIEESNQFERMVTDKDNHNYNIFHRAALDHNLNLIREIDMPEIRMQIFMSEPNSFGDTPLNLACMKWRQGSKKCVKFVQSLLDNIKETNFANKKSLWTALHWIAYHGDVEVTKLLLEHGASPALPDRRGYFPVDIAGYFGHKDVVKLLINDYLKKFKQLDTDLLAKKKKRIDRFSEAWANTLKGQKDEFGFSDWTILKQFEDTFLASSYFATKLLFWSCYFPNIEVATVEQILLDTAAYPEAGDVLMMSQSSFHAAVKNKENGNKKLELLFNDLETRKEINVFVKSRPNKNAGFEEHFEHILKIKQLKQMSVNYGLFKASIVKNQRNFDHQDRLKNTPLHTAAIYNNVECVAQLLRRHLYVDFKNIEQLTAKQISEWHPSTKEVFVDYMKLYKNQIEDKTLTKSNSFVSTQLREAQEKFKTANVTRQYSFRMHISDDQEAIQLIGEQSSFPKVPLVAIKFSVKKDAKFMTNLTLRALDGSYENFDVKMFKGVDKDSIYAIIDMDLKSLEKEAEEIGFPVKMVKFSAKVPFSRSFNKQDFLTFMVKDKQQIIINKFDSLFSVSSLKQQKVLEKIFPLHTFQGIYNLEASRRRRPDRDSHPVRALFTFVPHFLRTYNQWWKEDYHQSRFHDITAYKNYFGEKRCIINAFFEFYTSWFSLAAVITAGLVAYQYLTKRLDTKFGILFAFFISVWSVLCIEKWKRKEHHIKLNWGCISKENEQSLVLNPLFKGYNNFSWTNQEPVKSQIDMDFVFIRFLNILVTLILLTSSVFFYIFIKLRVKNFLLQGLYLNFAVGGINFIFKYLAVYLVEKENHKFLLDLDNSLMWRLAVFKFINIHLPILYALIDNIQNPPKLQGNFLTEYTILNDELGIESAEIFRIHKFDRDKSKMMYGLVIGAVISQIGSSVALRYGYKAVMFYLNYIPYRWKLNRLAKKQMQSHAMSTQTNCDQRRANILYTGVFPNYQQINQQIIEDKAKLDAKNVASKAKQNNQDPKAKSNQIQDESAKQMLPNKSPDSKPNPAVKSDVKPDAQAKPGVKPDLKTNTTIMNPNPAVKSDEKPDAQAKLGLKPDFQITTNALKPSPFPCLTKKASVLPNKSPDSNPNPAVKSDPKLENQAKPGVKPALPITNTTLKPITLPGLPKQTSLTEQEMINHNPTFKDKIFCRVKKGMYKGNPLYYRLLFDNKQRKKGVDQSNEEYPIYSTKEYFVEAVEINSLMAPRDDLTDILEITERMQLMGFSMLYAAVCPLATLVVFVYQIFDNYLMMYCDINFQQRPIQTNQITVGDNWIMYLEGVTVLAAISNCFMLYFVSASFKNFLESNLSILAKSQQLWFMIGAEHLLFGLIIFLKLGIDDIPRKLLKIKERTKTELSRLNYSFAGDNDKRVKELEFKIRELEKNQSGNNNEVVQLSAAERMRKEIKYYNQDKSEIVIKPGKLVDFLQIDPREYENKVMLNSINEALIVNFQIKLFRESFLIIERSILQRKLHKMQEASSIIQINCTQCMRSWSTFYCYDCKDYMCDDCIERFHIEQNGCKGHRTELVDLNPNRAIEENSRRTVSKQNCNPVDGLMCQWKKFENFHFPVVEGNDFFIDIQRQFEFFKKSYVDLNYMDQVSGDIDFASVFTDQNYDSLEREQGKAMRQKHVKQFKSIPIVLQKERIDGTLAFNDEELFFMNRIAFRLFKLRGPQLLFSEFVRDLKLLQDGEFEASLDLYLKLAMETEEQIQQVKSKFDVQQTSSLSLSKLNLQTEMLSCQKLSQMIGASFPQDLANRVRYEKIIDKLYSFGMDDLKPVTAVKTQILNDKEARKLMECILQEPDKE